MHVQAFKDLPVFNNMSPLSRTATNVLAMPRRSSIIATSVSKSNKIQLFHPLWFAKRPTFWQKKRCISNELVKRFATSRWHRWVQTCAVPKWRHERRPRHTLAQLGVWGVTADERLLDASYTHLIFMLLQYTVEKQLTWCPIVTLPTVFFLAAAEPHETSSHASAFDCMR